MYFNNNYNNNNNNNVNMNRRGRFRNNSNRFTGNRFRPYLRGRHPGHRNYGHNYRHNEGNEYSTGRPYSALQGGSDGSEQSATNTPYPQEPKCETIVLDLTPNCCQLTEPVLRQHFQQTYGTIKKIWFNATHSKAFISFFNTISVDMCLESGDKQIINGISVDVSPLRATIPPELLSKNGDQSHRLKNLCKSDNKTLQTTFPTRLDTIEPKPQFRYHLNRNEFKELVQIESIDCIQLVDNVLNATDMTQQLDIILTTLSLSERDSKRRHELKDKLEEVLNLNDFNCKLHLIGSTVTGLAFCNSDIDIFAEYMNQSLPEVLTFEMCLNLLEKICAIFRRCLKFFIPKPIPSVRCPIISISFAQMFKNSIFSTLDCDMSLTNGLAKHNSRLIQYYCQLEPRFRQLALVLRFWAKINDIVGGSQRMTSYAFTQLVIYFCQKLTGLAFCNSDIDIFAEYMNESLPEVLTFEMCLNLLEKMCAILRRCLKFFIPKPIPSVRCPIISISFGQMFKNSIFSTLDCDMSLTNGLAKHNSRLIQYYCQLEPRFRQLALVLRFWAKINDIVGGSQRMTSYAFTQLVIYFCQKHVYRMDCELLAKWDLIIGQLSPFVEFYIKLWDLDNRVIDLNTRLQFRQQISAEEMKQMSPIDGERYVTQSIINEFSSERSDAIPTECHFALVMNCRLSFPTVELVLIDMKPDFEMRSNLSTFLRRLIASAAHHCQLLTVPKEFI
ncbi:unnamed protein product [Oppiella nova]|uniref:Poly(A) RNA polymerase mitochondrial-like central palm domain-containing protein n=1 Tax=Oppiella nova TaxID=334625 RepID=A0A7R9LVW9_9ACAR|nr:unnamed protein product [Oppiella nova]CAG2166765.1 unnamed protein product [Oppiella nova]